MIFSSYRKVGRDIETNINPTTIAACISENHCSRLIQLLHVTWVSVPDIKEPTLRDQGESRVSSTGRSTKYATVRSFDEMLTVTCNSHFYHWSLAST